MSIRHKLSFLIFLSQLVYPNYNSYCFILYMLAKYNNNIKQQQKIKLHVVSNKYLSYILTKQSVWDLNNTIIINNIAEENCQQCALIIINQNNKKINRKVIVVNKKLEEGVEALISYNLLHNIQGIDSCALKICQKPWKFADEVEVSLISTSNDWSHFIIDRCLKNYFKVPKLLYEGDVIAVNLQQYGEDLFYSTNKIINIDQNIYFKCNKIFYQGKHVSGGYLCTSEKSILKQGGNVQSFIPKNVPTTQDNTSVMNSYFDEIKKAVHPFLNKNKMKILPLFLLEGRKGSGKALLVQRISSHFGIHLSTISNFDVSANVYAQNETKLRNILFGVKMATPSILEIQNFENFGKNNEGQHDERLINYFVRELKLLFNNNRYPSIVFCSSNEKNIPIDLKRIFLKIFEIKAPGGDEREDMLRWILSDFKVNTNLNLRSLTNKTQGFLFEDLRALVAYAVTEFCKRSKNNGDVPDQYFFDALDFMHVNYSEGLGAPKVPKVKWSDVGGLTHVKEEIIKTIKLPLKHPELLKTTGLKRSGILLYGPPGTGKTLIAKAVATECGLCFLSVKGPELLNMYVGQSEQNVREVFERAREASPCIIFFDELDSLAPNRGASGDSGGVMDRVVSQLLSEMDGLNRTGNLFIIGATNRPDLIDSALLRPGRFDKLLYVGPAVDRESKLAVLAALTKQTTLAEDLTLDQIVDLCSDQLSGADFYGICSGAWISAVRRLITENQKSSENAIPENVVVTLEDFKFAIKTIKPSIKKKDLEYFETLKSNFK